MEIVLMLSHGPENGKIFTTSDTFVTTMLDMKVLVEWNREI